MRDALRPLQFAILLPILLLAGCEEQAMPTPTPIPSAAVPLEAGTVAGGRLSVLGTLLPGRSVDLGFLVGGQVRAVNVQIGAEVKAGYVLAELDTADLALDVREAENGLAQSQARLRQAQATPREQDLAIAEAEYRRVLAQHQQLLSGHRPEEVAVAQADRQAALARYDQVRAGAGQQELTAAQATLEKAEIALKRAQKAYDLVAWRPDLEASPQAAALHEATVDYEAAKAQLGRLRSQPTQAQMQEVRAQLAHAEAQLELAQAGPSQQEVTASAAAVAIAQAQLDLARAGPRAEDVDVVEAQVQQACIILDKANLAVSRTQLLAPFDGTVSALYRSPGEWAGPGMPVVQLLDTSRWRVETRNVGELDIGHVRVGQEAVVRVIAFRDQELRGRVAAISPVAIVQQGDTTYTVFIELEPTDLNLRPGMNVEVEILTE
jgi:HlyD family secretion protein